MIPHLMVVDDEEDVLESMIPGFVNDLARRLATDKDFQKANAGAGGVIPATGRVNVKVTTSGYQSAKIAKYAYHTPIHLHLHLCCEKGDSFRHALRLLREQFFAVVVSDLRFADDVVGARAGRYFIEDVQRRNPDTFGILYSAYQRPDSFPADHFVRKGSAANLGGEELLARMVEGFARYLSAPKVKRFTVEVHRRGLVYQSDLFGATLRRLYDYADLYFGVEATNDLGRRRPRPTLLLDGETGTGKTELAGLLHRVSDRRDFPFVSATCSQLTDETFLRSSLFGHIKGSFSGASSDRPGLVQSAGKGFLLLDDLHKLNDAGSVILHSFLDDGEYCHLGEDEVRRMSEAAIVGTVETPRWEEIKSSREISESFIHRVEQLVLKVPPLRDRPEDIAHQAEVYCRMHADFIGASMELAPEAIAWLVDYGFPGGNSRKLRDFLKGVVTAHARVTDYLGAGELEEYAAETGLLGPKARVAVVPPSTPIATAPVVREAPAPAAPVPAPPPPRPAEWPATDDPAGWPARIARLAVQAVADELTLEGEPAKEKTRKLFDDHFPKLWEQFIAVTRGNGQEQVADIKLFDELLRYYAIYRFGSPAKAAKELGIKDNALREFVYSREQKRTGESG